MSLDTAKDKIIQAIQTLPQETTYEEAMERLYLLYKVEKGLSQAEAGKTVSHEEAKVRMQKWLS